MKQILFPTAYSFQSKVAYRYVQKLAQYFDASITLLHVYESPTGLGVLSSLSGENEDTLIDVEQARSQEMEDYKWEEELKKLQTFASEMSAKQFQEIPIDFIATDGIIANEIIEVINANDFDFIVMGMRQHTLREKLFGNTTYEIIDNVSCPLLLIPPTAHYLGMDKIVYGTAFQIGDEKAIDHLFDWCEAFDSKLHLLHIHKKENQQAVQEKMTTLMANYRTEESAGIMSFQLQEGKIQEAVEEYIKFTDADMLAIHRRKKGFWQRIQEGNLTKALAEDTQIPLLILP